MRIYLLTLILSLSTFASRPAAQERHYTVTPSPTLTVLAPARSQTTYQMLCRGNTGGVYFKNIDSRTITTGEKIVTYELVFTPSPQAAGSNGRGLEPGQCSWIDRPVNAQEPYAIRFDMPFNAQLRQKLNGSPVDSSPTAAERYPDAFTIPEYMKDENHYFSFYVYNSREGYLRATSYKYWKPSIGLGRVKVPSGTTNPPRPICEVAREARARNSPAAPGLEAQCRAAGAAGEAPTFDVNALAAKGEAIANEDPLSIELRNQQPEGPSRRGFDIGMAAAEGQTLPGPGKQRIHDALSPDEQKGFEAAVNFSLERNRNADFAARGAKISEVDPVVAEARNAEVDVFYRLGFDIATGIFGNPAQGAQGNTATGPGSLKIRDSLSAAGQRGFNDAVRLHLSRDYKQ